MKIRSSARDARVTLYSQEAEPSSSSSEQEEEKEEDHEQVAATPKKRKPAATSPSSSKKSPKKLKSAPATPVTAPKRFVVRTISLGWMPTGAEHRRMFVVGKKPWTSSQSSASPS